MKCGISARENFFAVVTQKFRVGFGQFIRQTDGLVFKRNEVLLKRRLRKEALQTLA